MIALWLLACAAAPGPCVGFGGDLALGRGLGARLDGDPDPAVLDPGTAWVANLEGALAPAPGAPCAAPPGLCLGFGEPDLAALDRLPLRALSLANNHALDHGEAGLAATRAALAARGIQALDEAHGPTLLDLDGLVVGLVALDLSQGGPARLPRVERALRQVVRARSEAHLVAVLPHWGVEEIAALGPGQAELALRFVAWGADLVVGSGAHVPQDLACAEGALRAHGLGNLLFDDPPGSPRGGRTLRCCAADGALDCAAAPVRSEGGWPRPDPRGEVATCRLPLRPAPDLRWRVHRAAADFESVAPFPPAGPDAFLALWWQPSSFDDTRALRPYVFRVAGDRTVDLWRGTALGGPLQAARVLDDGRLCAVERADPFLDPDPATTARRARAWRWTGFGFVAEGFVAEGDVAEGDCAG